MRKDFGHLDLRDAVVLGGGQMVFERAIGDALTDERADGNDAAFLQPQLVGAVPHLPEQNIVVEMREFGRELPKRVVACGLLNHVFSFLRLLIYSMV